MTEDNDPYTEQKIADHFFNRTSGHLHLSWAVDAYFGKLVKESILPQFFEAHKLLEEKGHTEENKFSHNDADNQSFIIPSDKYKILVDKGQSIDFLYISHDDEFGDTQFHIRRIWRRFKSNSVYKAKDMIKNMDAALANVNTLEEFADDHAGAYCRRPSLEMYRKIDFQIPYRPKDRFKDKSHYGDFRDSGYVISYNSFYKEKLVEGAVYNFDTIILVEDCFLPSLIQSLKDDI